MQRETKIALGTVGTIAAAVMLWPSDGQQANQQASQQPESQQQATEPDPKPEPKPEPEPKPQQKQESKPEQKQEQGREERPIHKQLMDAHSGEKMLYQYSNAKIAKAVCKEAEVENPREAGHTIGVLINPFSPKISTERSQQIGRKIVKTCPEHQRGILIGLKAAAD